MAEKQEVIGIESGRLNEPISKMNSTIGEALYKIDERVIGKIIFDNRQNTKNNYYTGKRLPVYNKETVWYVDDEGILRLQLGETSFGEGKEEENVNQNMIMNVKVTTNIDFTKAILEVIIEYEGEIDSVTINGEKIEVIKNSEGKYIGSKEVNENGYYKVVAMAKDESKIKEIVRVNELADNMEIWNTDDMKAFRDKANKGATYKDKLIEVMDNIDLKGSESNQWIPINNFYGTFEGNNYKIENLYIDNRGKKQQALFSNNNGIIQNLEVSGSVFGNDGNIALICGVNEAQIKSVISQGKVGGWNSVGGCVGRNNGKIEFSVNKAQVYPLGTTGYYGRAIGGISGSSYGIVENCINYGQISGNHGVGGIVGDAQIGEINLCKNVGNVTGLSAESKYNAMYIGGIAGGAAYAGKHMTKNCINIGEVKSSYSGSNVGGIIGYIAGSNSGHAIIENCYNLGKISGYTRGGIVAKEGYSSSAKGKRELKDNYYLNTCGVGYGRATEGSNDNAQPKSEKEINDLIKELLKILPNI